MENEIVSITAHGNKTIVIFKGNHADRDDYKDEIIVFMHKYLEELNQHPTGELWVFFREAMKNVYDHGNGGAVIILINNETKIDFKLIDLNPIKIDFHKLYTEEWVKKTNNNRV
jgi:hypothetical protein